MTQRIILTDNIDRDVFVINEAVMFMFLLIFWMSESVPLTYDAANVYLIV